MMAVQNNEERVDGVIFFVLLVAGNFLCGSGFFRTSDVRGYTNPFWFAGSSLFNFVLAIIQGD